MSRKIDALIAEHVMGFKIYEDHTMNKPCVDTLFNIPNYSTDISAAWGVVEKVGCIRAGESTVDCFSLNHWPEGYEVEWGFEPVTAKTAPMAICLAALKAKGVEVSDES